MSELQITKHDTIYDTSYMVNKKTKNKKKTIREFRIKKTTQNTD